MARSVNGWTVISSSQLNRNPFPATKIAPIPGVLKGDVATVLHYVGYQFNKKVEKLYNPGCWGYAYKKLGTISWSNHASGTAIDLNAPSHPWKKKGTFNTKQRLEIRKILNFLESAVTWGGDWSIAYVDEMHFEIKGSSAKIKKIANKIKSPMDVTKYKKSIVAKIKEIVGLKGAVKSKATEISNLKKAALEQKKKEESIKTDLEKAVETIGKQATKLGDSTDKVTLLNNKLKTCQDKSQEHIKAENNVKEVKTLTQKAGVKTTEFYLVLIPYALMILKTIFNIELEQEIIANGILGIVSLVTTGFYIWSRVQLKLSSK